MPRGNISKRIYRQKETDAEKINFPMYIAAKGDNC